VSRPELEYFEVVRVEPRSDARPELEALRGRVGAVLGISAEEGEPRAYAVCLDGMDGTWMIQASDLSSTGEVRQRQDYYDGTSLRVSVNGRVVE